jgi:transcriptional regulator with XRE-family HTH domain
MSKIWTEEQATLFAAQIVALKRYREDRGLTQAQVAGQLRVSARTLARWEHDRFRGCQQNADSVAAFLAARLTPLGQIEVDILFSGTSVAGEQCATFVVMKVATEAELRNAVKQHLGVLAQTGFIRHGESKYSIVPGSAMREIVCDVTEALAALADREG